MYSCLDLQWKNQILNYTDVLNSNYKGTSNLFLHSLDEISLLIN